MAKDYYSILGVNKSATADDIKKAFRQKAHQYHPDKSTGDEAKFKEINEAYQVLGNEQKRKQYDQFGGTFDGAGFSSGAGAGFSGFNWQDFMRQNADQTGGFRTNVNFNGFDFDAGDVFGDFFGGRSRQSQSRPTGQPGADLEYKMEIDLKESAFGGERMINFDQLALCGHCQGKGYDSSAKVITCPQCHGSGQVVQSAFGGMFQTRAVCPTCQGEGKKPDKFCAKCHGQGRVRQTRQLKIKIPAGINRGETIRLSGAGEAGVKGGPNGDLYITFAIKPDNYFKRQGYDILSVQSIDIVQAALGDKIDVDTLDGAVRLKIPSGTESGQVFKLSGKGATKLHGRGRGDHLVEIVVTTPKSLSRKAKKLLEELKREL